MAKKNIADKYWIYGEDAELAARLTSYLTRVVYNQRANYIRALMKIKEHECSIEDCDSDIESQSMRSGNSLEESIESKLMWEAIRKYLPKLELKECEVMIRNIRLQTTRLLSVRSRCICSFSMDISRQAHSSWGESTTAKYTKIMF